MPSTVQASANQKALTTQDPANDPPDPPDPYMTDLIDRLSTRLQQVSPDNFLPKPDGTPAEKALDLAQRLASAQRATSVVGACHFIRGSKECFVNATHADCAVAASPASFDWAPGQVAREGWFEPVSSPPPPPPV
ncbi:hypothetical protein VT84_08570 [Gemmata sp. SH-PL17]|uniref:hypothetical protein n=1 Tax=Gemmata sp. SH-PL17 TaxID=1630693 RepID=UPI0004B04812|nr:hypothetical protein [Gemmata sp. SH-PL17]AMV24437.1 hypothetical protein VT84_08570 [Gemmata sp. SH-PL17]